LNYLFFHRTLTPLPIAREWPSDLTLELWRPTLAQPLPPDLPLFPFGVWSAFHFLKVFSAPDYAVLLIRQGERLVNRTCIFPPHFKFPFMRPEELQLAGLWTDPTQRGRGLGFLAVQEVFRRLGDPRRSLWYLAREGNRPSIRLAEKAGFQFRGMGARKATWSMGRFHFDAPVVSIPCSGARRPPLQPAQWPEEA
jgi:RimJ/RimL family protein N-acetyltransferase